jgi:transposase-like protein
MLPCMGKTSTVSRIGKRPRRSRAAWLEDVKRWRESGQSAAEYAREHDLHAGTLMAWGSKLRVELPTQTLGRHAPAGFLPVRVAQPTGATTVATGGQLEVVLRNGRRVLVSGEFGVERLARLLDVAEGGARC